MLALHLAIVVFMGVSFFFSIKLIMAKGGFGTWQSILASFFFLSGFQLIIMYYITTFIVNELVGLEASFGFRQQLKKTSTIDLKVLTFTPHINRPTVILAKFTLTFTLFGALSLLTTLLLF